jgi:hypothetical protein
MERRALTNRVIEDAGKGSGKAGVSPARTGGGVGTQKGPPTVSRLRASCSIRVSIWFPFPGLSVLDEKGEGWEFATLSFLDH